MVIRGDFFSRFLEFVDGRGRVSVRFSGLFSKLVIVRSREFYS